MPKMAWLGARGHEWRGRIECYMAPQGLYVFPLSLNDDPNMTQSHPLALGGYRKVVLQRLLDQNQTTKIFLLPNNRPKVHPYVPPPPPRLFVAEMRRKMRNQAWPVAPSVTQKELIFGGLTQCPALSLLSTCTLLPSAGGVHHCLHNASGIESCTR